MKHYKVSDFSTKEVEEIKKEIAKRIKDYVFMVSKEKASEVIDKISKLSFIGEDVIEVNFQIDFLMNDILQIIGRLRRDD